MKQVFLFFTALILFVSVHAQEKLMGFTDAHATKQLDWEKQFDG